MLLPLLVGPPFVPLEFDVFNVGIVITSSHSLAIPLDNADERANSKHIRCIVESFLPIYSNFVCACMTHS